MKFLRVLGKILLVLVLLIAAGLAAVYGIKAYRDHKEAQHLKQKAEEKAEMLSRFNYTIPAAFRLPKSGDRGYPYIDYIYEEDDMIAQIKFEVWNKEEMPWLNDVNDLVDYYVSGTAEREGEWVSQGPTEADLNGLPAKMFVRESHIELFTSTLSGEETIFVTDMDECVVAIFYNIIDEAPDRDDAEANGCFTLREEFINSISAK